MLTIVATINLLSVHAYSLCGGVMYSAVSCLEVYIQSAGIEFLVPKLTEPGACKRTSDTMMSQSINML